MPTNKELQEQLSEAQAKNNALLQENTVLKANQVPTAKTVANPSEYLPESTAQEYKLVNWVGGHTQDFGKHGTIDLRKLTPQRAAVLVAKGFKKLIKK